MLSHPCPALLEVVATEGAAAVRVLPRALDEVTARAVGGQLVDVADGLRGGVLYLDLGSVTYLTSTMLAVLLELQKKLRAAGGRLRLHNFTPTALEVFQVTRLNQVFEVYPERLDPGLAIPESA
jgi:anti-sigma B factor antagonist